MISSSFSSAFGSTASLLFALTALEFLEVSTLEVCSTSDARRILIFSAS